MKTQTQVIGLILLTWFSSAVANVKVETLLSSGTSWNGGAFSYAQGKAKIVVKKITVTQQKGAKQFHCHPVPLVAYINKGVVKLQTKSGDSQTFSAGDSLVEVMNQWHIAHFSKGTEIIAFHLGNDKLPNNIFAGDKLAKLCR